MHDASTGWFILMDTDKVIRVRRPIKLWDILKICLAVALLGYVASKTNFSQLLALRDRFSWTWFWITFLFFVAMIAIKTAQYYYLLGKKLPYSRILEVVVLQNALMNFVTTAAGIASYLTMLGAEKNIRLGRATVSFIMVKMVDLMAVLLLLLGSIIFLQPLPDEAFRIFVIISVIALSILAFFIGIVLFRRNFAGFLRKMAGILKLDRIKFVQGGLNQFDLMAEQSREKILRTVMTTSVLSLLYMVMTMGWGYARLRMFSLLLGLDVITFVHSILQIVSWVPVLVLGGLGISETLSVYLFSLFGESQAELAAILISARLIFYLMNAFTLIYLPIETLLHANRREAGSR
jgi:uncharacterized membrane protein YbhN (UPF0104 family)